MLFESTTILLRNIVHSIDGNGETGWDDLLESGNQCLYELHQLARSSARTYKSSNARFPVVAPAFERATRAIPHVKLMMGAFRRKDKLAAIENGRAAISEMCGIEMAHPSAPSSEPKPDSSSTSDQPAKRFVEPDKRKLHQHKEPLKQKRAPVAKRKAARASAAGSR